MLQILSHTPPWVFALFAALLVLGLLQARTRRVKPWPAFLLPAGMVVLSLAGIQSSFGFNAVPIAAWLGGAGRQRTCYKLVPANGVAYDPRERVFVVPGSWAPLVVIMAIFFTKYAFAATQAMGVSALGSPGAAIALSLAYGCFSGYFGARAARLAAAGRR